MRTNNSKKNIFITIILFIVGTIVFSLFSVFGFIYTLIKYLIKKDFKSIYFYLENILYKSTAIQDQLSNVIAGELLNDTLVDKSKEFLSYGDERDTISRNTGENLINNSLSNTGLRFNAGLDLFLGLNHSTISTKD